MGNIPKTSSVGSSEDGTRKGATRKDVDHGCTDLQEVRSAVPCRKGPGHRRDIPLRLSGKDEDRRPAVLPDGGGWRVQPHPPGSPDRPREVG